MQAHPPFRFFKMHGCGNDFILMDNRDCRVQVQDMADWAKRLCPRAFSVGADGLIFLEEAPDDDGLDYRWHFFNADGSRAEMCGNASRCAAKLALALGFAGPDHVFGTDAGPIKARVMPEVDEIKVQLTPYTDLALNLKLNLNGSDVETHFVNTGVPHLVLFHDNARQADLKTLGPAMRYHEQFAPKGVNANIAQVQSRDGMILRTYERGVEDETHACGTGAAAAVVLANKLGLVDNQVRVETSGKEILTISLENDAVFLQGKAILVYEGMVSPEILHL